MGTCGSRFVSDGSWLLQGRNEWEGGKRIKERMIAAGSLLENDRL